MSNKIVPAIYRAVIDDVIAGIKSDFDEFGVGEEVLAELQHKWENKVIASHVAEFETHPPPPPPPAPTAAVPPSTSYPPHSMHVHPHYAAPHNPYAPPQVKAEPVDPRYVLSAPQYTMAPLPGPQLNGGGSRPASTNPAQQHNMLSFPMNGNQQGSGPILNQSRPPSAPTARIPQVDGPSGSSVPQIPQVDGPSSSSASSGSDSPPSYAPHSSHPSLPQPSQSTTATQGDDEAINSDLDDSDTADEEEEEEGGGANGDIVFCTYDKVARVKNKWKCVLKDGMIHINGKDYLFAKCTGEFEW